MKISRIKETCIYVTDLHRTKEFYSGLGLTVLSLVEGRHIFFRAGTSVLLCFIAEETRKEKELPPHGTQGSIHFAFEVGKDDEYAAALAEIKNKNITILHEQTWKAGLRSFYFHDPDGHLVEIIEEGIWEV